MTQILITKHAKCNMIVLSNFIQNQDNLPHGSISHTSQHNSELFFHAIGLYGHSGCDFFLTVLSDGKSKVNGVWSALPMSKKWQIQNCMTIYNVGLE